VADRKITAGAIIWATVPDRNGHRKDRPLVVISVDSKDAEAALACVCISTRRQDPLPEDVVELPWDPRTGASTGLYQWCAAVASWVVAVEPDQVRRFSGSVPKRVMDRILDKVSSASKKKGKASK
jgi:mRNA-degrading endonuclease toxin of MazEF toxin-antitoxin module